MTPKQRCTYWRLARPVIDRLRAGSPETDLDRRVMGEANRLAAVAGGPPTDDDIRHAGHIVALGADKSSKLLDNHDLDRVFALFQVLANPDSLSAMTAWVRFDPTCEGGAHPSYSPDDDPGERRRIMWRIRHTAPEAYIRRISTDRFGVRQWDTLRTWQLRQLAMTLVNRQHQFNVPVAKQTADCPF